MTSELILYAGPVGPFRDTCDDFFEQLARPTVAQTYPPHCTLTGFFHRDSSDVNVVVGELSAVLDESGVGENGAVPKDEVSISALHVTDDWVGFELTSPFLIDVTQRFAGHHVTPEGADDLRPKSWLHLSLAYGVPDLSEAAMLTATCFDPVPPGGWEIGLWERQSDGSWSRHV